MTNIIWELDLTCTNCKAHIHLTSDLGDTFKLSRDYKRERLLKEAEALISQNPRGMERPWPTELQSYIEDIQYTPFTRSHFQVKEMQTRFVKCPICRSRIYVC